MQKKQVRVLTSALSAAFVEKHFLQKLYMPKKKASSLVRQAEWEKSLEGMFPMYRRLSCAELLELSRPLLSHVAPEPPEGWMAYAYAAATRLLFPEEDLAHSAPQHDGAICYLNILQVFLNEERKNLPFDRSLDFAFCTDKELEGADRAQEYLRFLSRFREEYIYEMMRLGREVTPFSTLEHIAGVHDVAMTIAREFAAAGGPVDLSLVSGAAAGHDIGKFGCKPGERVPYLHYYYTDCWFNRRGIAGIGHIAANHSTWDLEIENLSTESLLLIYADFRVKQSRGENGREITTIYPLDKSFEVILNKLDNVDDAKRLRYEFVYAKLQDFEDYLIRQGVDVTLSHAPKAPQPKASVALLSRRQAVTELRMMAVEHNLSLMHRLGHERLFANVLEAARSEKSWKRLRAYVSIFEEYFAYLSGAQKAQTLSFLYELLMYREADIRRQAATLIGRIIAGYNAGYKKELPASAPPDPEGQTQAALFSQYLGQLVSPDHKLTVQQKARIHYTLKIVVQSLLENSTPQDLPTFLEMLLRYYDETDRTDEDEVFALLDTMSYLPLGKIGAAGLDRLLGFARRRLAGAGAPDTAAVLRFLHKVVESFPASYNAVDTAVKIAAEADDQGMPALVFLRRRILRRMPMEGVDRPAISDIFLDNLKTATPWILKAVNIDLLVSMVQSGQTDEVLHIAAHFSNLIKVSENVVVRHTAGASLLELAPALSPDQRNEIAVELAKGVETGQYEFSKYIPECLGKFSLYLAPEELDEMLERLVQLMASSADSIVCSALTTVGCMLEHYSGYAARFGEGPDVTEERRRIMVGMLLKGLASYRETVRQEALLVLGKGLFGSSVLSYEDKTALFTLAGKKLLFLIDEYREGELTFFYRAAALSHLYRFIVRHAITSGQFVFDVWDKVAFFPGTFDPFTLSHKGIVKKIRDMGFEVYLAVDEFSWSKKTQPSLIRRQIVSMSVADEFHVHLFPHDLPVNIARPEDLARLRQVFSEKTLYLAVGSDVVAGASSYRAAPVPGSVHSMNHIVFRRASSLHGNSEELKLSRITGDIIELALPTHLEDISSSRIRENIDLNRDISNLIDPVVQDFIYQNSLYLREPQYKQLMGADPLSFVYEERPGHALLEELTEQALPDKAQAHQLEKRLQAAKDAVVVLRDVSVPSAPRALGFATLRTIGSGGLLAALGNVALADWLRSHASGRILLITGLYSLRESLEYDADQLLLTEVLTRGIADDCGWAAFCPAQEAAPPQVTGLMLRQGFFAAPAELAEGRQLMAVDMTAPIALIQNMETTIKPPFSSDRRVLEAMRAAHRRLQSALANLYPGTVILSLNGSVMHHRLVKKVTALNRVPETPTEPRVLGDLMCVPFGKVLRGNAVPNTVTKTVHTDKVYDPDITVSRIEAFPYYAPLESQMRTVKSFGRPVLLVDDLIHSGDRIQALAPMIASENIEIRRVLVGLLSGRGRDLMETKGYATDCVYYIPNLRGWFVESTLYPFIGGDTVRRAERSVPGLLPSVNMILPYATPKYYADCERRAVFEFSRICLENARDILNVLESEYRAHYARNLTLSRLSEAVILPLCPDKGGCMSYDENLASSVYLDNDLTMLLRMREALI